jgi:hypothetical protein
MRYQGEREREIFSLSYIEVGKSVCLVWVGESSIHTQLLRTPGKQEPPSPADAISTRRMCIKRIEDE